MGDVSYMDHGFFYAAPDMAVLGIDPGSTGCAVTVMNIQDGTAGSWRLTPTVDGARRLVRIMDFVSSVTESVLTSVTIREIVMEGYSLASRYGREEMGEAGAAIKLGLLRTMGVENPVAYPTRPAPNTLKKFVTGDGGGKKERMLLSIYKKWGVDFKDNNMADSYGLARMGLGLINPEGLLEYEKDALKTARKHYRKGSP